MLSRQPWLGYDNELSSWQCGLNSHLNLQESLVVSGRVSSEIAPLLRTGSILQADKLGDLKQCRLHNVRSRLSIGCECWTFRDDWPTVQCFDTVGWVIWPVKIVPDMTYNVFGETLNPTLIIIIIIIIIIIHCRLQCRQFGVFRQSWWYVTLCLN